MRYLGRPDPGTGTSPSILSCVIECKTTEWATLNTPPAKRQLGYYAMPMLWRDNIIGWVTISNQGGDLSVDPGLKKDISPDLTFDREFEAEVERFRLSLQKRFK